MCDQTGRKLQLSALCRGQRAKPAPEKVKHLQALNDSMKKHHRERHGHINKHRASLRQKAECNSKFPVLKIKIHSQPLVLEAPVKNLLADFLRHRQKLIGDGHLIPLYDFPKRCGQLLLIYQGADL